MNLPPLCRVFWREHEQFMEACITEPNTLLKSSLDASLRIWWGSSVRTGAESIRPSVWFMGEVSDWACLFSVEAHTHTLTPVTDGRGDWSLKPEPTRLTMPSHSDINQCLTHTPAHTHTRMCVMHTLFSDHLISLSVWKFLQEIKWHFSDTLKLQEHSVQHTLCNATSVDKYSPSTCPRPVFSAPLLTRRRGWVFRSTLWYVQCPCAVD